MIAYIKGILAETEGDRIVVETGGIGYQIFVPLSVFDRLPARREQVQIYTYFAVREDAMSLYGFLTRDDREVFRLLLGVNGIGPK
ncbi:MAG: Holliday junction branch migration protein RuvA, partial [Lachnospiraceae bacterium]|nr:Holliday junction branch migration protein RuvA [Lachnospiraceae bacterium]